MPQPDELQNIQNQITSITANDRKHLPMTTASHEHGLEVKLDKALRLGLDGQLQVLKSATPSRERSLAITKLQECIMWLGMDLKRLNEADPYPNSYKPENTIVEPTADGLKL